MERYISPPVCGEPMQTAAEGDSTGSQPGPARPSPRRLHSITLVPLGQLWVSRVKGPIWPAAELTMSAHFLPL